MYCRQIRHRRISRILIVSALAIPARAGDIPIVEGIPKGYELVRLTDDPAMQHSVPDINDAGEVVFGKFVSAQAIGNLYRFSGGMIQQLTDDGTYDLSPVTNNVSNMAWIRCVNSHGPFDVVGDFVEGPVSGEAHPVVGLDMNAHGDIVWDHLVDANESLFDIYLYTHADGNITQITNGGNNQEPRINSAGQVVWRLRDDSVHPWRGRIMLYSDGEIAPITPEDGQAHSADINDAGHVVYRDGFAHAVLLWNGVESMQIASAAYTPKINNAGDVGLAIWDDLLQLRHHCIFKDGIIYMLPSFGLTTNRCSLNNRSEMALNSPNPSTGHRDLFLLRRAGPKGDGNHDCHIDMTDFRLLQACRTASPGPEGMLLANCIRFDFDNDGDVDPVDFGEFLGDFTGPDDLVPDCEP